MKVLIDACVLYPTVLREIVLGVAETGAFQPLWSDRILEEWRRAALRYGHGDIAALEIEMVRRGFPEASVSVSDDTIDGLTLPDPSDVHVLAAAIDGAADELLTLNLKDFPTNALARWGIVRRHPDEFLLEAYHADPICMSRVVDGVLQDAEAHGINVSNPRAVLKRARLPRLGKALYAS